MKLSKDFSKIENKFSELIKTNKQNISDTENDIAKAEQKKAAEDSRAAAAAVAGNEGLYREAMISKQFNEDRLKYLTDRLKSLQVEPLTDQAEANNMLEVIRAERERLDAYANGDFKAKFVELIRENEELLFYFDLCNKAEALIHSAIIRDGAAGSTTYRGPQMLNNIRADAQRLASINSLPGVKAGSIPPVTDKQRAEQNAQLEKWEV